jgi:FAD/FMN-containing dehydrogenase
MQAARQLVDVAGAHLHPAPRRIRHAWTHRTHRCERLVVGDVLRGAPRTDPRVKTRLGTPNVAEASNDSLVEQRIPKWAGRIVLSQPTQKVAFIKCVGEDVGAKERDTRIDAATQARQEVQDRPVELHHFVAACLQHQPRTTRRAPPRLTDRPRMPRTRHPQVRMDRQVAFKPNEQVFAVRVDRVHRAPRKPLVPAAHRAMPRLELRHDPNDDGAEPMRGVRDGVSLRHLRRSLEVCGAGGRIARIPSGTANRGYAGPMAVVDVLARDLGAIVGAAYARVPNGVELEDATRWSGLRGTADAIVSPADARAVADVVRWCATHDVPITVRGGGTGLAGGAVPDGGVVLSMERLARVRSLDAEWWRCEVEAGVTTATIQRRAAEAGLRFPPDPGAAHTSQIGGNLATNAGGPHAFGHGSMRAWVLGVEAVLAPGELVRFGGPLRKDVAGYDLTSLLVGSEGTLGVITAAWLRLIPPPGAEQIVLGVFPSAIAAQDGVAGALTCGAVPAALELLDGGALQDSAATLPIAGATAALAALDDPGAAQLMIAHLEGDLIEPTAARGDAIAAAWQDAGATWTASPEPAAGPALSTWRAGVSGAVAARRGGKLSEDVTVPAERLAELLTESAALAHRRGLEHAAWGHAGDGNIHCSFLLNPADPHERQAAHEAAQELFALTLRLGGTVTGEHGIGRLKNGQLGRQWAPAAAAAHAAIKTALDPTDLFGRGRKLA